MDAETNPAELPKGRGISKKLLSIIVPAFNEELVLREFHRRLSSVLDPLPFNSEMIYINDGSTDKTLNIIQDLRETDPRIAVIDLSRNFGKEIAMSAGLDYAKGDAVVIIDADLQDPPELISEFIKHWEEGFDVVYAQRTARKGETLLKKATAYLFYRFIGKVSRVTIPEDTGDFRLLSRRAVEALRRLREQHRFMKGLYAWIGYPQKAILYQRGPRFAGKTKWNYWKLWNFALEGVTSFTIAPLKISTYLGLIIAFGAFIYALYIVIKTIAFGDPVKGYPSLMVVILFLGGIQLITLGVIGEYLGRMFDETKQRPLYVLKAHHPSQSDIRQTDPDEEDDQG
jgi:glycosyltransferase involved in cell wall biosynthesis